VGVMYFEPVAWTAGKFKVPLSPLSPALAVLANIFLVSSLGIAAYIRFAVWLVVSMAVYLVYGVHRTAEEPADQELAYTSLQHATNGRSGPAKMGKGQDSDGGAFQALETPGDHVPAFDTALSTSVAHSPEARSRERTPKAGRGRQSSSQQQLGGSQATNTVPADDLELSET
jgi:C-terminus of AA_permease